MKGKVIQVIKKRTYEILKVASPDDLPSKIFDIFISILISLNVIVVILETVETLSSQYQNLFNVFELFSVVVFSVEYVLRIWSCTAEENYHNPVTGRVKFALTPFLVIDLLAILPFYLPMFITLDLRFIRALRLIRLLRVFKLARYSESLRILGNVFKKKKAELYITVFILVILLVIVSSFMYFLENEAQPKVFSSIPASMWWGMITLTTVGYGDIYPITIFGKLLGVIMALLGIGMFALPTAIIASGFTEEMQKKREKKQTCPHCGKEINP